MEENKEIFPPQKKVADSKETASKRMIPTNTHLKSKIAEVQSLCTIDLS